MADSRLFSKPFSAMTKDEVKAYISAMEKQTEGNYCPNSDKHLFSVFININLANRRLKELAAEDAKPSSSAPAANQPS